MNKVPSVKVGSWSGCIKKKNSEKLRTEFLEDIDTAERYSYDFNQFYSPGNRACCKINIFYKPPISDEIGDITVHWCDFILESTAKNEQQ